MRYIIGLSAFFLLLIGVGLLNCFAQQADEQKPATQPSHAGPTAWMQEAKTPQSLAKLFQARFNNATDDQLNKFMTSDDAGDAISAGWETVRRSLSATEANDPSNRIARPDQQVVSDFLKLVNVRTGGAADLDKDSISLRQVWIFRDSGPKVSNSANFQKQGNKDVVTTADGANSWTIADSSGDSATACLTDGFAYLATYKSSPASHYTLYAIDRTTNATVWSGRVWADDGFFPASSGPGSGKVEVTANSGVIVVFGVENGAAYIERFDAKTGNNLSRFCTDYYGK